MRFESPTPSWGVTSECISAGAEADLLLLDYHPPPAIYLAQMREQSFWDAQFEAIQRIDRNLLKAWRL